MILAFDLTALLPSSAIPSLACPVVWCPVRVFLKFFQFLSFGSYDERYNTLMSIVLSLVFLNKRHSVVFRSRDSRPIDLEAHTAAQGQKARTTLTRGDGELVQSVRHCKELQDGGRSGSACARTLCSIHVHGSWHGAPPVPPPPEPLPRTPLTPTDPPSRRVHTKTWTTGR